MTATDRRKYDIEFMEKLIRIEEQMTRANARLDKINGSVKDYQATKERFIAVCEDVRILDKDVNALEDDLDKNIRPLLNNLQIKMYTLVGLITLVAGGIGSTVGALIVKFTAGG